LTIRKPDLHELPGLDREAADMDPDPGAEVGGPGRHEGRDRQQHQRRQAGHIGVALQQPVVLEEHHHCHEQGDAQARPDQLVLRRRIVGVQLPGPVQPPDEHQADAVQQRRHRQHQRIRVRGVAADREVRAQGERAHAEPVAEHPGRHPAVHRHAGLGVGAHGEQHREHEQ
jgi:hypothetical protein